MKHFNYILLFKAGLFFLFLSCAKEKPEGEIKYQQEDFASEGVRPAPEGGATAAYFSYYNDLESTDTLISISSPISEMVQVHESYETEDGMMGMREQKNLIIESGDSLLFKPGNLHIMLMQLNTSLQSGDSVAIQLELSQKGLVEKKIPVL